MNRLIQLLLLPSPGFQGATWHARFVNDQEVVRLFGTDTLPTPFGGNVSFDAVRATIQASNPGVIVERAS